MGGGWAALGWVALLTVVSASAFLYSYIVETGSAVTAVSPCFGNIVLWALCGCGVMVGDSVDCQTTHTGRNARTEAGREEGRAAVETDGGLVEQTRSTNYVLDSDILVVRLYIYYVYHRQSDVLACWRPLLPVCSIHTYYRN